MCDTSLSELSLFVCPSVCSDDCGCQGPICCPQWVFVISFFFFFALSLRLAVLAQAFHLQSIHIELFMKGKWQLVHNFQGWSISTCTKSTPSWIAHLCKNFQNCLLKNNIAEWMDEYIIIYLVTFDNMLYSMQNRVFKDIIEPLL